MFRELYREVFSKVILSDNSRTLLKKNLTGISLRYRYKSPVIACPGNQYRKNPISAQLHKDVVL